MSAALAYYNEFDPAAAAWLRNLIACGLIAPGVVDTRSITEVQPDDLRGFTQVHLFAGIGGWSRAARLAGWPDARPLWSASCPCQPFSVAGKGAGRDDPRHLWPHVIRLAGASRPVAIVGEQVAGKAGYDWFDGVAADLEAGGYACRAVDVPACAVDAPHIRSRQYWVAVAGDVANTDEPVGWLGNQQPAGQLARHEQDAGICVRAGSRDEYLDVADDSRNGRRTDIAGRRPEGRAVAGRSDGERALVDAPSIGRREGSTEPEFRSGRATVAGAALPGVGLADAYRGSGQVSTSGRQPAIEGALSDAYSYGRLGHNSARTFWSDHEWLACHDGKARRTKPGLPLLAHGIRGGVAVVRPDGLGVEGIEGFPALQEETRLISRIAAWKGFGNAIVPQLAAEVIAALMECGGAE